MQFLRNGDSRNLHALCVLTRGWQPASPSKGTRLVTDLRRVLLVVGLILFRHAVTGGSVHGNIFGAGGFVNIGRPSEV